MIYIGIVDRIVRSMDVPEAVSSVSKVTVISDYSVLIENHKGVSLYTPEEIQIRLKKKRLVVYGSELAIEYLNDSALSIHGRIGSVSFS